MNGDSAVEVVTGHEGIDEKAVDLNSGEIAKRLLGP